MWDGDWIRSGRAKYLLSIRSGGCFFFPRGTGPVEGIHSNAKQVFKILLREEMSNVSMWKLTQQTERPCCFREAFKGPYVFLCGLPLGLTAAVGLGSLASIFSLERNYAKLCTPALRTPPLQDDGTLLWGLGGQCGHCRGYQKLAWRYVWP